MGRLEATVKLPTAKKANHSPAAARTAEGRRKRFIRSGKASMDDYVAKRKAGWKG
jgi:hypothetical protein